MPENDEKRESISTSELLAGNTKAISDILDILAELPPQRRVKVLRTACAYHGISVVSDR